MSNKTGLAIAFWDIYKHSEEKLVSKKTKGLGI